MLFFDIYKSFFNKTTFSNYNPFRINFFFKIVKNRF